MTKNIIQFQKDFELHEFLEKYATEEQCWQTLFALRWPTGYVCPECGNTTGSQLKQRPVYQCHKCHHQTSLTAGTIFHGTKLPLKNWFLAIYLLTQHKKSTSALQLSREIGVNYNTAWKIKHKLIQVMMERERKKTLNVRIEQDARVIPFL
jgi:transposase-like protein